MERDVRPETASSSPLMLECGLFDETWRRVYASLIFERTRPVAERLRTIYPDAIIGGIGWDRTLRLEDVGVTGRALDYSLYPGYRDSIGFTQRGCRLKCPFCVVPEKEGKIAQETSIREIWRGDPFPKHLLLLDNDFFGAPGWRDRIREIRDGGFKVCFNQGINARLLNDETAAALASVRHYDDDFRVRRIYTAWDNRKDEAGLFAGLNALVRHGVKPCEILVYMLIVYWSGRNARGSGVPPAEAAGIRSAPLSDAIRPNAGTGRVPALGNSKGGLDRSVGGIPAGQLPTRTSAPAGRPFDAVSDSPRTGSGRRGSLARSSLLFGTRANSCSSSAGAGGIAVCWASLPRAWSNSSDALQLCCPKKTGGRMAPGGPCRRLISTPWSVP